jgi:hypothetical protein
LIQVRAARSAGHVSLEHAERERVMEQVGCADGLEVTGGRATSTSSIATASRAQPRKQDGETGPNRQATNPEGPPPSSGTTPRFASHDHQKPLRKIQTGGDSEEYDSA